MDTALDHRYAEAFGFTRPEVDELAARLGHADKVGELAEWYDGYSFGGEAIYNPWSVLNYLDQGCVAQPYWTNTSSNLVVKNMIASAGEAVNAELQLLVDAALDNQALSKCYAHGLAGKGAILWGVAFDATKHVAAAAARL